MQESEQEYDLMELLTKIDNNPNVPLILLNQICSTAIDHKLHWKKYEKINILLIGGHGSGKSTLLNFIEDNFKDLINIEREGKFSPKGYLVNTLTVKAQDAEGQWQFYPRFKAEDGEKLISQIPEVGQNNNEDSYDALKQLHDGYFISSTKADGKIMIDTDNVFLQACANQLDFKDVDSQAVLNRYIIILLPNDRVLSFEKVFKGTDDLTDDELQYIKTRITDTLLQVIEPLSTEDIEIIEPYGMKYLQALPDIDVLDGCRPYTQFITLVHINMYLLDMSIEASCKFVYKFLIDNHMQLYQFLLKDKKLIEPDWRQKIFNFLHNVAFANSELLSKTDLVQQLSEFYQIKKESVRRRKLNPLIELNWLEVIQTDAEDYYSLKKKRYVPSSV